MSFFFSFFFSLLNERVFVFWSFFLGGRGGGVFFWGLVRVEKVASIWGYLHQGVGWRMLPRAKTHLGKPTFFFSSLTCILRVILTYFERFKDTRSRNKSNNAYTHTSMLKYVSAFVSEPSRKMGRNKPKFFVVNGIFLPTFLSIGCILNPASSSSHTSSYCNRPKQTNKSSGFMYTSRVITFLSSSCAIVWLFNGTKHFT